MMCNSLAQASAERRARGRVESSAPRLAHVGSLALPQGREWDIRAYRRLGAVRAGTWQGALRDFVLQRSWSHTDGPCGLPWLFLLLCFELTTGWVVRSPTVADPLAPPEFAVVPKRMEQMASYSKAMNDLKTSLAPKQTATPDPTDPGGKGKERGGRGLEIYKLISKLS